MSLTLPKWRAHGVAEWDKLLVDTGAGQFEPNDGTTTLINLMFAIGMTNLTRETADEVWCRIAILQALFGSIVVDPNTGQQFFLTRSDVFRHIGIETEGTPQSFSEFCEKSRLRAQRLQDDESVFFAMNGKRSLLKVFGIAEAETPSDT